MRRMYHDASRQLQDRFDTRRLADRLAEKLSRTAFTDEDSAFIASQAMFFFATADADGWPECSYKGGVPGFVRVLDAMATTATFKIQKTDLRKEGVDPTSQSGRIYLRQDDGYLALTNDLWKRLLDGDLRL